MQQFLQCLSNWLFLPHFIQRDTLSLMNHKHQYSQQVQICLGSCWNSDLWQRQWRPQPTSSIPSDSVSMEVCRLSHFFSHLNLGGKVFFLDQWTLLSRWKNLIGFLQNAANSYQECILRGVLLSTDLLLSQPYVIPSSRSDSSKRQKISVSHPSRWDYRTRRKSKFSAHLYNLSYNSSLIVQAHWDVKVTEILLLFLKWGIWTFMNGQLFAEWTSDLLRFTASESLSYLC